MDKQEFITKYQDKLSYVFTRNSTFQGRLHRASVELSCLKKNPSNSYEVSEVFEQKVNLAIEALNDVIIEALTDTFDALDSITDDFNNDLSSE